MKIREARAGDAARLVELASLLGHDLDAGRLAERLSATEMPTLVATEGDEILAFCGLASTVHVHRDQPVGRITILVVAERARRRGVGGALVDEAERRLANAGCELVEVTSNFRFEDGHAFYEARGFARSSFRFFRTL